MKKTTLKEARATALKTMARNERRREQEALAEASYVEWIRCEECRGTGYLPVTIGLTVNFECPKCDGSGIQPKTSTNS